MGLEQLEKELNESHHNYLLAVKLFDVDSDEYINAKNIYLEKAEEFRNAFQKTLKHD